MRDIGQRRAAQKNNVDDAAEERRLRHDDERGRRRQDDREQQGAAGNTRLGKQAAVEGRGTGGHESALSPSSSLSHASGERENGSPFTHMYGRRGRRNEVSHRMRGFIATV